MPSTEGRTGKSGGSHPLRRLRERLPGSSKQDLTVLRRQLRTAVLPRGDHYVRLGAGSAVLKDLGKRHVIATVLGPGMTHRPGRDVTMMLSKNALWAGFADELCKIAQDPPGYVEGGPGWSNPNKGALSKIFKPTFKRLLSGSYPPETLPGTRDANKKWLQGVGSGIINTAHNLVSPRTTRYPTDAGGRDYVPAPASAKPVTAPTPAVSMKSQTPGLQKTSI